MGIYKVTIEPEFKDIISTLPTDKQMEIMKGIIYYPDYVVEDCKAWTIIRYMLDKQNKKYKDRSDKARAAVTKRWADYKALKLGKATTVTEVTETPSTIENKDATATIKEEPAHIPDGDDEVIVTIPKPVLTKTKEQIIDEWNKIEYAGDRLLEESRDTLQIETFIKKINKWVELHKAYPLIEYGIWPDVNLTKGNLMYLLASLHEGINVPVRKIDS